MKKMVMALLIALTALPVAGLQELQKRLKSKPLQVVVLALDRVDNWKKGGSEEKSLAMARETGLTFAWADEETFFQYGSSIPSRGCSSSTAPATSRPWSPRKTAAWRNWPASSRPCSEPQVLGPARRKRGQVMNKQIDHNFFLTDFVELLPGN